MLPLIFHFSFKADLRPFYCLFQASFIKQSFNPGYILNVFLALK